jgi:hypothetical protein
LLDDVLMRLAIQPARRLARRAGLFLGTGFLMASTIALAQSANVPTVSRLVKLFMEREIALQDAMRSGGAPGIGASLADDFELRAATQPARPIPRDAFIAQVVKQKPQEAAPVEMAVHDVGSAAIASFRVPAASGDGSLFVVDVWRRTGNDWKLAIRYASASAPGITVPGTGGDAGDLPKRY